MAMTSPPYWGQRQYDSEGIGLEQTPVEFIDALVEIVDELGRVLKPTGSFWLNLGDTYHRKGLAGIPWRVVLRLVDERGWMLRNEVVWNKLKGGMDQAPDRLANTHELLFHLVKQPKYFYDVNAIRSAPRSSRVVNGAVISATGVSGVRYRRQIELSTALSVDEKALAMAALENMLRQVAEGEYSDFRMVIRGQQRSTHSDRARVSGRAKELNDKGFYFLRYHPLGSKPNDVWDIIPEDTQSREGGHFAVFPVDLCRIPILSTCPPDGIVLDPFAGTGTTLVAATILGRRSVGIDISESYLEAAAARIGGL
jgi:DNA modification methylase